MKNYVIHFARRRRNGGVIGQYCVVGLGSFGRFLATKPYQMGHDVLAVDIHVEVPADQE